MKVIKSFWLMIICLALASALNLGTGICWAATPQLAAGCLYTLIVKGDGTLWAWGNNDYGQLGDGTFVDRLSPVQIGADNDWAQISVSGGGSHTIALKNNGTLWAWGYNDFGQLGDGTLVDRLSPVQIGADTDWTQISAGGYHSTALKNNGTLWAWGYNDYGQLGDGTLVDRFSPVQIGADTDWTQISTGGHHTVAMKHDGALWAWGNNNYGQLGDGTFVDRLSPIQIGADTDWAHISAGGYHSTALKNNGTLWAWGRNSEGELGDGTVVDRRSPLQIGPDADWDQISAGGFYTTALKNDATLWTWGYNNEGELGDGTFINRYSPVRVGADADWAHISAGGYHSIALKKTGTLWAWGYNQYGQLGENTYINRLQPTAVKIDNVAETMPSPVIQANGQEGSIIISEGTPVAITISLAPGDKAGQNADWWIAIHTPFAPPIDWQFFVFPTGWKHGINLCVQNPLFEFSSFEVLSQALPQGHYTFYFAIDDPDGALAGPWWGIAAVDVTVE